LGAGEGGSSHVVAPGHSQKGQAGSAARTREAGAPHAGHVGGSGPKVVHLQAGTRPREGTRGEGGSWIPRAQTGNSGQPPPLGWGPTHTAGGCCTQLEPRAAVAKMRRRAATSLTLEMSARLMPQRSKAAEESAALSNAHVGGWHSLPHSCLRTCLPSAALGRLPPSRQLPTPNPGPDPRACPAAGALLGHAW
jgi:hypothetical protein